MRSFLPLALPLLLAALACPKGETAGTASCPPCASGATADPAMPPLKETDAVATVKGQPVLAKEVLDKVKGAETKAQAEYLKKLFQVRDEAVRGLVLERLLKEAATQAGLADPEAYLRKQIELRKKPADDKRLRELYARLVPNGSPSFEDVKPQVAQALEQQDSREIIEGIINDVLKANDVKWLLKEPLMPKVDVKEDDDPVLGDPKAKVTIIEFSDFECPYCGQAAEIMHKLVEKYDGKVKVVFRDFPLSFHKSAKHAAVAAGCAHAQGKFWPFHDQLFKNQHSLEDKALKTYARVAGLDGEKFDTCLASNAYEKEVEKDVEDGNAVGVDATPSFFINGRPYAGAPTLEDLSAAVDAALSQPG